MSYIIHTTVGNLQVEGGEYVEMLRGTEEREWEVAMEGNPATIAVGSSGPLVEAWVWLLRGEVGMENPLALWERPPSGRCMVAGWYQWADGGAVSSGVVEYLVEATNADKIGEIDCGPFYLFQIPGMGDHLRPWVKVVDGVVEEVQRKGNEFFHGETDGGGVGVFIGHEPHHNMELYAKAFLDAVEELGVRRVVGLAGVYAPVPYEEDRDLVCVYSLPRLKEEMTRYGYRFSDYSGGSTVGMYLVKEAERRGIEFVRLTAIVPAYDLSKGETIAQPMTMKHDYKGWYDVLLRLNGMCSLDLDLSDVERMGRTLISDWDAAMASLGEAAPELDVGEYMEEIRAEFAEKSYATLDELWEEELADLFEDEEEQGGDEDG